MATYNIAAIPGDGIGKEVIPEGIKILETVSAYHGISFNWETFDWSCEHYAKTGRMMPEDGLRQFENKDAIFLGAAGFPGVPDHISLPCLNRSMVRLPISRAGELPVRLPQSGPRP